MATDPAVRRTGLGARLLRFAEPAVLAHTPTPLLWCNARTPAVPFYEKQGWRVVSDPFDIPTAGPHVKMLKDVAPAAALTAPGAAPRSG